MDFSPYSQVRRLLKGSVCDSIALIILNIYQFKAQKEFEVIGLQIGLFHNPIN